MVIYRSVPFNVRILSSGNPLEQSVTVVNCYIQCVNRKGYEGSKPIIVKE